MAVVINAKGTSVQQFQIGKQGPLIKNVSGNINFKDSTDSSLTGITIDSEVVGSPTGGDQGSGSVNAVSLHINGNALPTILTGSNTLDFGSIASLGLEDLTITVTGAAVGDEVALGLPAAPTSGIIFNTFVSAADTVTVRAHNYTAGAIDPASATYSVRVFQ